TTNRDFWADRLARTSVIVDRAIARGELPPNADARLIIQTLIGPLYVRLLLTGEPVTAKYADRVAAPVASGALTASQRRTPGDDPRDRLDRHSPHRAGYGISGRGVDRGRARRRGHGRDGAGRGIDADEAAVGRRPDRGTVVREAEDARPEVDGPTHHRARRV